MPHQIVHPERHVSAEDKLLAMLSYILFFIPLLLPKPSPFALYHANQGLLLLIMVMSVNVIGTFIPVLGWLIVLPFGNLLLLIYLGLGWFHALKGEMRPLPGIGHYQLIKL